MPMPGDFLVKGRPGGGGHVDISTFPDSLKPEDYDVAVSAYYDEYGNIWVEVRGGNVGDQTANRKVRMYEPGNKYGYSHLVRANE